MNIDDLHELDDPEPFVPDAAFRARVDARGRHRRGRRRAALGILGVATTMLVLVVGFGGYQKWRSSQVVRLDLADRLDPRLGSAGDAGQDPPPAPDEAVNILVVGSDAAMPGEGRELVTDVRTDTMMIVRADPDAGTIAVLSLPRDLWVDIPDHGMERLNTAWETGGPALLIDTIKANLAIPINHFLQVDGQGFQRIVDQSGGSAVWVAGDLRDTTTGFVADGPGCVHLDGTQALALVRSRHLELAGPNNTWTSDPTGDLGRIERQQVMGLVFASSLLDQDLSITAADDLLDTLIDNAAIDDTWAIRDMAGLLLWAQNLELDENLVMTSPPVRGGYAGEAAVLYLETDAAQPVLDLFRPAPPGASADDAGPGATTGAPASTTSSGPVTSISEGPEWVLATAPDGTRCPS